MASNDSRAWEIEQAQRQEDNMCERDSVQVADHIAESNERYWALNSNYARALRAEITALTVRCAHIGQLQMVIDAQNELLASAQKTILKLQAHIAEEAGLPEDSPTGRWK